MFDAEQLREQVRERYAAAAVAVTAGSASSAAAGACCAPGASALELDDAFGSGLYSRSEQGELPAEALAASLGCGNPLAVAELRAGERVLDLGSGGGIDVLLSARRVGPTGYAYGLDMTEEMLALARANAVKAGATNVEFLPGRIEDIPLPDAAVDVIISNCVINLSTDKAAVLAEMYRVLAPGGRIGISDVVAEDGLSGAERAERGSYVGCIAGALSRAEYLRGLAAAGFDAAEVIFTHEAAPGMHAAIVRAAKPAGSPGLNKVSAAPVVETCCTSTERASCCEAGSQICLLRHRRRSFGRQLRLPLSAPSRRAFTGSPLDTPAAVDVSWGRVVSHHLKGLREAGVARTAPCGRFTYCADVPRRPG